MDVRLHGASPWDLKTDRRAVCGSCERELPRRKAVASMVILQEPLKRIGHLLRLSAWLNHKVPVHAKKYFRFPVIPGAW